MNFNLSNYNGIIFLYKDEDIYKYNKWLLNFRVSSANRDSNILNKTIKHTTQFNGNVILKTIAALYILIENIYI